MYTVVNKMSCNDLNAFTNFLLSQRVFICGICGNLLKAPILLVETIGNVCSKCLDNKDDKANLKIIPNTILEVVLSELKIPCKFEKEGCNAKVMYKDVEKHEDGCSFSKKLCPLNECPWNGLQGDFTSHFLDKHDEHTVKSFGYFRIDLTLANNNNGVELVKLLNEQRENKLCLIKIRHDPANSALLYSIFSECAGLECSVKLCGNNNNCIKTKVDTLPLGEFWKKEEEDDNWIRVDLNGVRDIIEVKEQISINIKMGGKSVVVQELNEKMLHFFECPVCKNLMKPPIYQCNFGHSFCNVCRPLLEKCPTCRGIFGSVRNYSLEGLTANINYTCMHHHLGCTESSSAADMGKHEVCCPFKPYPCPQQSCTFTGNYLTVTDHLKSAHSNKVILDDYYKVTVEFRMDHLTDYCNYDRIFMIVADNIYRLSFKRNFDYCFWAVEVLRSAADSNSIVYEIGILDMRRQNRKLIRTDLCFQEISPDDLFKKCILFPNNILSSYASNGTLTFYCKIHK